MTNSTSPTFAELFEESLTKADTRTGTTISAKITNITSERITVNAGLKSDAVLSTEEFKGEDIQIGDMVDVVVETLEDGCGNTRVSREKARRNESWHALEKALTESLTVKGLVTERVKGGFTVDLNSVRAFLPGSLVDTRPTREPVDLEGQELEFRIIKLDKKRNNVVVSRRAVIESTANQEQRQVLLDSLKEGQVLTGVVKNLTDYGAFVDLGGLDGLLHITDMHWKRVKHPSEILQLGDSIQVKVLKYDAEKKRVSLGLKQLDVDPWQDVARRYPAKSRLFGRVTNIMDYGCFVQIDDYIEGLVHVSEMDWTNKNVHPGKLVQLGDEVEVMVLEIDEERRRISLGIKQCQPNPWEEFAHAHAKGDKVTGAIRSITDFGLFIGLEGGIDGLIHLSDLSYREEGEAVLRRYKKGEQVDAIILAIDPERERISLGVKQLETDPFSSYLEKHPKGSPVSGKIVAVENKRILIELDNKLQGSLRTSELSNEVNVGDTIEAKLVGLDRKSGIFNLSLKAVETSGKELKVHAKKEPAKKEAPITNTTLGDLLREQMEGSKEKE